MTDVKNTLETFAPNQLLDEYRTLVEKLYRPSSDENMFHIAIKLVETENEIRYRLQALAKIQAEPKSFSGLDSVVRQGFVPPYDWRFY